MTRRSVLAGLAGQAAVLLSGHAQALPAQPIRQNPKPAWQTLPPTPGLPTGGKQWRSEINGTRIFHAECGKGPPVFLLHGGLANSDWWGHQVRALASRHRVIVMDTRGHGRSPVTSSRFSYRIFAEDVLELMDTLLIPRAAIIGWSDGAITGLQLALMQPERISGLFAFGGNTNVGGYKPGGASNPLFTAFTRRCRKEYAVLANDPAQWGKLVAGLRPMWRTQPDFTRTQLRSIRQPVTIAAGEHDEIIRRAHTERMVKDIPGSDLNILPGVSHFAMLQDPRLFNAALARFLGRIG